MRFSKPRPNAEVHDGPARICPIQTRPSTVRGRWPARVIDRCDPRRGPLGWIAEELAAQIGAEPSRRSPACTDQRNGHRPKVLTNSAGDIAVGIPKLRKGSNFREFLEPRRRTDWPCVR